MVMVGINLMMIQSIQSNPNEVQRYQNRRSEDIIEESLVWDELQIYEVYLHRCLVEEGLNDGWCWIEPETKCLEGLGEIVSTGKLYRFSNERVRYSIGERIKEGASRFQKCFDTNQNGLCDESEDINGDSHCSFPVDCYGSGYPCNWIKEFKRNATEKN
jgi:hypothetical protein